MNLPVSFTAVGTSKINKQLPEQKNNTGETELAYLEKITVWWRDKITSGCGNYNGFCSFAAPKRFSGAQM